MPWAVSDHDEKSVWRSMSRWRPRRSSSRSSDSDEGRLSSGSRKSGRLGSRAMKNGSYALPRKLACWPGVTLPSRSTWG